MERETIKTDVLILGAGIAGCRAAIEAHDHGTKVLLTTKGLFTKDCGATWMAAKGYQAWGVHPHDTLDVHAEDTIRCGWFLNNQENVYAFLAHAPDTIIELNKWGGRYQMKDNQFLTHWSLGCSIKEGRNIQPHHGSHGYVNSRIFPKLVRQRKITIIEDMFITDLLTNGSTVVGAIGIDIRTGRFKIFEAKATILATGGYQGLYKITTANLNLTGDGQAMALRAGVDLMGFEFNQTLPVALWPSTIAGSYLPFELLVNYDGRMYNNDGERFMFKWDPEKMERTTRAIISRAIFHEIKAGKGSPHGGIYMGINHRPELVNEFKNNNERTADYEALQQYEIDLSKDYIETGYAMHYCQGGCNVNSKCETDKVGLYAIGEVASGGKDGSDRMMANALPYCMAMGIIAGREAAQRAQICERPEIDYSQVHTLQNRALAPLERKSGLRVYELKPPLQDEVVTAIGYGRTKDLLETVLKEVERYKREIIPELWVSNKFMTFNSEWVNTLEFENLVLIAECIIRNALMRKESRGLHDRWDYPAPDQNMFKNIHLRLVDGEIEQWTTPVEFTYWRPEEGSHGEPWHGSVPVKKYQGWRAEPIYSRM